MILFVLPLNSMIAENQAQCPNCNSNSNAHLLAMDGVARTAGSNKQKEILCHTACRNSVEDHYAGSLRVD